MNRPALALAARALLYSAVLACALGGCAARRAADADALAQRLAALDTLAGRPGPVVRHRLLGRTYYFLRGPCCDQHDKLYDERGAYVCAPSGGFTGQGDGRCPALRGALAKSEGEVVPNPFEGR